MKKTLLLITLLYATYLVAQPVQYASKEINGCNPTGYTNILTLEWLTSDTVRVSKSQRLSTGGDIVCSYDLAGLDTSKTESSITFLCEDNIWVIPFEGNLNPTICQNFPGYTLCCTCEGLGECKIDVTIIDNVLHTSCNDGQCTACCKPDVTPLPNSPKSVLFLRAKAVLFD